MTDLPPVTDALIEEVIATADQATPGRWKLWGMAVLADQDGTSNAATAVPVCETQCRRDGKPRTFDAHHIRLMDPPTAKALALEVRRLQKQVDGGTSEEYDRGWIDRENLFKERWEEAAETGTAAMYEFIFEDSPV